MDCTTPNRQIVHVLLIEGRRPSQPSSHLTFLPMKCSSNLLVVLLLLLPIIGCEQSDTLPTAALVHDDGIAADAANLSKSARNDPAVQWIIDFVQSTNARLEAGGGELRLDYPWLFRVGGGTDPFATLRTGSRWTTASLEYVIDESDYSEDVPTAQQEAALISSFESWNEVARTYVQATRGPDEFGPNPDVLDGTFYLGGEKRSPLPTEVADLTTLYTGHLSTTN